MPQQTYDDREGTPGSLANFIDEQAEHSGSDGAEDPAARPQKRHKRFRIRAQRLSLTYSQIDATFDKKRFGPWLEDKCGAVAIRVGLEVHPETGGLHIHAYIDTGTHFIINNSRELDYNDHHPNIVAIRVTPHKIWDYVGKDGDVIYEKGSPPPRPVTKADQEADQQAVWREIIMSSSTPDEFINNALAAEPKQAKLHFQSLKAFADWKFQPKENE